MNVGISSASSQISKTWGPLQQMTTVLNPLIGTGNYSATSNNMKLVHWPLTGGLLHLVQRRGLGGAAAHPGPSSLYHLRVNVLK